MDSCSRWEEEGQRAFAAAFCQERNCRDDKVEKIFRLDPCTVLATSEINRICDHTMDRLITDFKEGHSQSSRRWEDFILMTGLLCSFLNRKITDHLTRHLYLKRGLIIITRYDIRYKKTYVCKIRIRESFHESLQSPGNFQLVGRELEKIVRNGYCPIDRSYQKGKYRPFYENQPCMVRNFIRRIRSPDPLLPAPCRQLMRSDPSCRFLLASDMELLTISESDVRRAIDLAILLMRLTNDIQMLDSQFPAPKCLRRLAVVGQQGFQFLL